MLNFFVWLMTIGNLLLLIVNTIDGNFNRIFINALGLLISILTIHLIYRK